MLAQFRALLKHAPRTADPCRRVLHYAGSCNSAFPSIAAEFQRRPTVAPIKTLVADPVKSLPTLLATGAAIDTIGSISRKSSSSLPKSGAHISSSAYLPKAAKPTPGALEREKTWPARGIHVFQCPDQLGVVSKISDCVARGGANILNVDLHIDFEAEHPTFYSRSEFAFHPERWPRDVMDRDFEELGGQLAAHHSLAYVFGTDKPPKMAVLASRQDHCLVDLLYKWQEGELGVDITCVVSNHERGENTHVRRFLQRHAIPYHFLPTSRTDKKEEEILALVGGGQTDFLVLARYMQVLSPPFLSRYGRDIINIHHGLLPSFKGASPYAQAYRAGVKLIGATSHFVSEELDAGPIIEQLVDRVSHRDALSVFAAKSETLEKQCLARAVKYYCEHRICKFSGNKTVVFA